MHATGRVTVTGAVGSFDERDLPGVQATLLLVFLALERAPVARDRVADMLWIGEPPPGWSSGLNALASKIRSLFGSVGVDRGVLVGSGGTIGLDLPSDAWIDLESADRHLDRASGSRRRGDLAGAVADATVATAVLRRPFLPGIDNPWCDRVRRRNGTLLFKAYEMLAEAWNDSGDHHLALTMAESALALDPLAEGGYRQAIIAHVALGDRARAARLFDDCTGLLDRELGVEPSPETGAALGTSRGG